MCKDLKFAFSKAKKLPSTKYQNRKVNWDNFTLQIVSGIDDEKYYKYIFPFYSKKN